MIAKIYLHQRNGYPDEFYGEVSGDVTLLSSLPAGDIDRYPFKKQIGRKMNV
jgi:hypothetical protein